MAGLPSCLFRASVQATWNVLMRVVSTPLSLIVRWTFSSFPFAVLGTVKRSVATPPLNDSLCRTTFPATDGSHTIVPVVRARPVSLRVTLKLTVAVLPATSLEGAVDRLGDHRLHDHCC